MLAIVFMEKIESNVNARVAVSKDLGVTWNEFSTSDLSWSGQRYDGYDYIGISSADGRGVPVWSDNRGDWASPVFAHTWLS